MTWEIYSNGHLSRFQFMPLETTPFPFKTNTFLMSQPTDVVRHGRRLSRKERIHHDSLALAKFPEPEDLLNTSRPPTCISTKRAMNSWLGRLFSHSSSADKCCLQTPRRTI